MPLMEMSDRSTKVVYAALAGNVLVAVMKFVAAAFSGSAAMLTEAIHSSADCANQILLIVGNWRSRSAPDESHAFGYGLELYFWTFVVAIMVLLAGGGVSIYTGFHRLLAPEPISSPLLSLGVLIFSALFEGISFSIGYREYQRVIKSHVIVGEHVGLWRFIKRSKDPNLYESLLEDGAALIGIAIATAGVVAAGYWGLLWADGIASILIGLVLVGTSMIIATATRSLIAGETVARPLLADIKRTIARYSGLQVVNIATLHFGPNDILIALTLRPDPRRTVKEMRHYFDDLTSSLKAVDRRITRILFRFSDD